MTKYYTAEVPIWIDEVSDIKAWASEFKNEEAKEVVLSIGAFIYCFRRPKNEEDLESARQAFYAINEVVDKWFDLSFDGSKLAISTPAGANASLLDLEKTDWEGFCDENEFEFIDCSVDKARELGRMFDIPNGERTGLSARRDIQLRKITRGIGSNGLGRKCVCW